ncbi:MAG: hypothetical protein U1G08_18830 [Verrucomicrobiota bacterium]
MKTQKLKASAAGPIPAALTAVFSLRDIDGRDIWPGLYRTQDGSYVSAKCRDGIPFGPVTEKLSTQSAFRIYRKLLDRIRPGMDMWRDGEARLLQEVAELVPEDPVEAGERLSVCIHGDDGPLTNRGVFTDGSGRFYTGIQKKSGGEIRDLERVTIAEALLEASEIWETTTSCDFERFTDLIRKAAERLSSVERRRGVELRVEVAATTERSLRKAAARQGVELEEFAKHALARNCAAVVSPLIASTRAGN